MSENLALQKSNHHHFVFHGQAWPYFIICLVNVILSIITLGLFTPWAWVRCRRYLCDNMELNGERFGYHGRGITILLSWVCLFVVLAILSFALAIIYPAGNGLELLLLLLLLLPIMIIKGLSYHAMMTSFQHLRFGFQCHPLRAWWVMLGMPALILLLTGAVLSMLGSGLGFPSGINGFILGLIFIFLLALLILAVFNGVVYSHWLELIGKGAALGKNKFNISVNSKHCVLIFIWAAAIQIPFVLLFIALLFSVFAQMITGCMFGLCNENAVLLMAFQRLSAVLGGYFLLAAGGVLSAAYAWAALRNHAFNNLVLGDNIHFRSTLTFSGLAPRLLALTFLSFLTLGLAYPWLKINLVRYIAANTAAVGDLAALVAEADTAPQPALSVKACGGVFPVLPFL